MGDVGEKSDNGLGPYRSRRRMLHFIDGVHGEICENSDLWVKTQQIYPHSNLFYSNLVVIPVKAISPSLSGCLVTIEKDHTLWVAFLSLAIFETSTW